VAIAMVIIAVWAGTATLAGEELSADVPLPKLLPAGAVSGEYQRPPYVRSASTGEAARMSGPSAPQSTTAEPAQTPDEIRGFVTSPAFGATFNPSKRTTFAFTFAGEINADPNEWFIAVDALKRADADPGKEENWRLNVATFRATGGGPDVFTFLEPGIVPFRSLPNAWNAGGLGRLRVRVTQYADPNVSLILPVRDSDGIFPANAHTIIVADIAPDPTKPRRETNLSIRSPLNDRTPNYLNANSGVDPAPNPSDPTDSIRAENATREYYAKVQTDPDGVGPNQSISETLPTLFSFYERYIRRPFEDCVRDPNDESMRDERHRIPTYFNKGDLGVGREMHCINRGCTGELACYVQNFAPLAQDKAPIFDAKARAERLVRSDRPFATVAMVERQRMDRNAANRVFFVVYNDRNNLQYSAQLDNKGFNTQIPGNCLQCHGANSTYCGSPPCPPTPGDPTGGLHEVRNAFFLPFDLDAFKYFSADPDDKLSRARQEDGFRALNRMVRFHSSLQFSPVATELIEGWYGGDLRGGRFNGDFVQEGWRIGNRTKQLQNGQLYKKLYAIACRTCHLSYIDGNDPANVLPLSFNDPDSFIARAEDAMCGDHHMPAAEQTLKVLWQSSGRAHYFGQSPNKFGDCRP